MNRDLIDYQEQYSNQPYEKYQVAFRKRKLIETLNTNNHKNLLEVGCGLESIFLDFDTYENLTVLEPADMFFQKCVEDQTKANNKNIKIHKEILQDAEEVLKDESFDFIIVSSLLHEIPNQKDFLKTLHNISNPETVIHINVPNARSFHRLLAVEMGLIDTVFEMSSSNIQFQQHQVFDIDTLISVTENSGFEVVDSGSYSFKPFTHSQMQKMIDTESITEKMLNGFFKMEKHIPGVGSEIFVNIKIK